MNKSILIFVAVLVVVGGALWFFKLRPAAATSGYKAVFLSNNQVYFGKVKGTVGNYVTLDDVYYLTVQKAAAQGEKQATTSATRLNQLGGEAHGPEGSMVINRQHILFMEDLRADSPVVKGIQDIKNQPQK